MMFLILLFSNIAQAPTGGFEKIDAICDSVGFSQEMLDVACDIERAARVPKSDPALTNMIIVRYFNTMSGLLNANEDKCAKEAMAGA
jgi:hypothetical protein